MQSTLRLSLCANFALLLAVAASREAEAADRAADIAFFENRVRPILVKHCFECHDAAKQEGGVRLDHRQAMLSGGDSGPSIVPGKPEESLLIEAVRYEGYEMPPKGQLPDDDIATLVTWVKNGAVWPEAKPMQPSLGDQDAIRSAADSHWSFQPIVKPQTPATSDPDWALQPLDHFVRAKLDDHGLRPSPPAKRMTLIRRVFSDLIGLPPTPEIVAEVFGERSLSEMNYRDIVDGLLASDHYGERMARHWMDVARYADTRDFLAAADLRYPFAYTYRDWLIHAFNEDMPYDEFVKQQLAADFMTDRSDDPNLAALGFLTVGPLFRNNTLERTADRIDTVSRGLMGLTASCARCHDHKYDPVSIEDYYALYGVFRDSVTPDEFPEIESPLGGSIPEQLAADYLEKHTTEKEKLAVYEQGLANEARKDLVKRFDQYLLGYVEMNVTKTETDRGLKSKRKLEETALKPIAINLDRYRRTKSNMADPVLGPMVALLPIADKDYAAKRDQFVNGGRGKKLDPAIREVVAASTDRLDLAERLGKLFIAAMASDNSQYAAIRLALADKRGEPFFISPSAASQASRLMGVGRRKLQEFQEAIRDVEATHPGAPPKAMTLEDAEKLAPVYVMFRGEPQRRGPKVDRRFLEYFTPGQQPTAFANGSGRLELAEKICSPKNPLTPRVLVNRVWRMHFGDGLVRDAGDFGLRSDPPVQQELMDYLAASILDDGWSVKRLHRQIVLSSTYRQKSTAMDPPMRDDGTSAVEIDAENKLFWRQNRRRLDFESMRDGMLAAANTIDLSIGGKSVPLSETPHPTRRTVYAYIDRVEPDPVFATFDVAPPTVSTAQRTETMVPQQALFAMNNPFVTEQARAIVARDDFQTAKTDAERINILASRVFQREARPNEVSMVKNFLAAADQMMEGQAPVWQYGYGSSLSDGSDFKPLAHFDGKRYTFDHEFPSPVGGFLQLHRLGGHPGADAQHSIVRRWTAPADRLIRIGGTLERQSDRGDGVRGLVRINDNVIYETTVRTGSEKTGAGFHRVSAGDHVDFVVDPLKTATSDSFRWTVVIESRVKDSDKILDSWVSGRDFAGPPPPALAPWEQAAQAFLMTNEFLFVD